MAGTLRKPPPRPPAAVYRFAGPLTSAGADRLRHGERLPVGPYVVHPEGGSPPLVGDDVRRHGAKDAILGLLDAGDLAYKLLARRADEDGETEGHEDFQPPKEQQVVFGRLPETDAGVEDYVPRLDTGRDGLLGPPSEEVADLAHHVVVAGGTLHSLGLAQHVHEDDGTVRIGDELYHAGVCAQRGYVVNDPGPGFESGPGSRGAVGVYRDDGARALGQYGPYDRHDPADLFLRGDGVRAGAGGLASDVYYLRAFVEHGCGAGGGLLGVEEVAAIREGVRGDVEDAHESGVGA